MRMMCSIVLVAVTAVGLSDAQPRRADFTRDTVDQPPTGFEFGHTMNAIAPGNWLVEAEGENKYLAHLAAGQTGARVPVAVLADMTTTEVDVSVRFRPVSGRVRESVFEGKFQLPKSQKAVRTIPLGSHAVKALSSHRARATRTAAGDLVFGNRKGDPLREAKLLTQVLQPAAEKAGLGRVTWHQFRHIHSSLLNDLRVPVKIAQEQLGPRAFQRRSTSTRTSSTHHIARRSRRSRIDCFAMWPEMARS